MNGDPEVLGAADEYRVVLRGTPAIRQDAYKRMTRALGRSKAGTTVMPLDVDGRQRVEVGHNHTTDGLPTYPVCREACPLGCDKPLRPTEQIEITPGRFVARPRQFVLDPIAEGEAVMAVAKAKASQ